MSECGLVFNPIDQWDNSLHQMLSMFSSWYYKNQLLYCVCKMYSEIQNHAGIRFAEYYTWQNILKDHAGKLVFAKFKK